MTSDIDELTQYFNQNGPAELCGKTVLDGGISHLMVKLDFVAADKIESSWLCRKVRLDDPGRTEREHQVLTRLKHCGVPVPSVRQWLVLPHNSWLVLSYIKGDICFALDQGPSIATQAATSLALIHKLDIDPAKPVVVPEWVDVFERQSLAKPVSTTLSPRFLEAEIRSILKAAWPLPQTSPVLLHGDYWPGNWLWQSQQLACVLDWEDAAMGDPLIDLAVARLELSWIFDPDCAAIFTNVYLRQNSIDTATLPYWDLVAALRLITLAGEDLPNWGEFFEPYGRFDIRPDQVVSRINIFIKQAFDAL